MHEVRSKIAPPSSDDADDPALLPTFFLPFLCVFLNRSKCSVECLLSYLAHRPYRPQDDLPRCERVPIGIIRPGTPRLPEKDLDFVGSAEGERSTAQKVEDTRHCLPCIGVHIVRPNLYRQKMLKLTMRMARLRKIITITLNHKAGESQRTTVSKPAHDLYSATRYDLQQCLDN